MHYAILKTRCTLCGVLYEETLCLEDDGRAWKAGEVRSPEDGCPWCPPCLERINMTCYKLCADTELSFSGEVDPQ
jgi:hypothetical protein